MIDTEILNYKVLDAAIGNTRRWRRQESLRIYKEQRDRGNTALYPGKRG